MYCVQSAPKKWNLCFSFKNNYTSNFDFHTSDLSPRWSVSTPGRLLQIPGNCPVFALKHKKLFRLSCIRCISNQWVKTPRRDKSLMWRMTVYAEVNLHNFISIFISMPISESRELYFRTIHWSKNNNLKNKSDCGKTELYDFYKMD